MRFIGLRDKNGSAVTLLVMLMPLLAIAMIAIINSLYVSGEQRKLDVAANRAAFAGASVIANGLNAIAKDNWRWHEAYRNLKDELDGGSGQSDGERKERVNDYWKSVSDIFGRMSKINAQLFENAAIASRAVLDSNQEKDALVEFGPIPGDGGLIRLRYDLNDDQLVDLKFNYVEGSDFTNPFGWAAGNTNVISHLAKDQGIEGLFYAGVVKKIPLPMMPKFFHEPLPLSSQGFAMAYGGSMADFSLTDASDIDEATNLGGKDLYKPVLLWRLK